MGQLGELVKREVAIYAGCGTHTKLYARLDGTAKFMLAMLSMIRLKDRLPASW